MKTKKTVRTFAAIAAVVVIVVFSIRFWHDYRDYKIFDKSKEIKDYYSYKENHPHGLYMAKAGLLKNNIWDKMITRYDSISGTGDRDEKASDFFKTMLYFMKDNDVNDIYVKFDSTNVLTNFCDYPDSIKKVCDSSYSESYRFINNYSPPNDSNTIKIREHFTTGQLEKLQEIIFDGLTKTFNLVFGNDFISLKLMEKENVEAKVVIVIKYLISNAYVQVNNKSIPEIIPYSINYNFNKNIPGVSIDFKGSKIDIQSIKKMYEFGSKQNSEETTYTVEGIQDAYGQLTRSCFKNFVENFSTQFGLFNYGKFDKKALQIVLNILTQYGMTEMFKQEAEINHKSFDKEDFASNFLERLRKSRELFTDPQKLEADSLILDNLMTSRGNKENNN